jgi:hypothetical protein
VVQLAVCIRSVAERGNWQSVRVTERTKRTAEIRLAERHVLKYQRKTNVLMRLGTSPAGITAMDSKVFVSIAETERAAELET